VQIELSEEALSAIFGSFSLRSLSRLRYPAYGTSPSETVATLGAILLERIDPTRRMGRYYALRVEPSLLGGWVLVREWGRIGAAGRLRLEHWPTREAARGALAAVLWRKLGRGYRARPDHQIVIEDACPDARDVTVIDAFGGLNLPVVEKGPAP
jgi:predicted DNA-binding WGR domain protein